MKVKLGFKASTVARYTGGTYSIENFREAIISDILIRVGERIKRGDILLSVVTDKVTVDAALEDLCQAEEGTILTLNYANEETWILGDKSKTSDIPDPPFEKLPDGDLLLLPELGWIETEESNAGELQSKEPPEELRPEVEETERETFPEKKRAAPAVRKLAREAGIDVNTITGTGLFGRVTIGDVKNAMEEGGKAPPRKDVVREDAVEPQEAKSVLGGVILLTPSREWLTVSENLSQDGEFPTAGGEALGPEFREYDLRELLRVKAQYREAFAKVFGVPLHVSAPAILAVTRVLRKKRFWIFNGYWHIGDKNDRSKDMVALYKSVNMGISVDFGKEPEIDLKNSTIGGTRLRIATLHRAHELGLKEFLKQHHDLISRVASDINGNAGKMKKTALADWTDWTFIFNNIGAARHVRGLSVLTKKRKISAMLNMGVIGKDGKTVFQVFFDHRMIDGVPATLFMDAVYEELLERVIPEIELVCAATQN